MLLVNPSAFHRKLLKVEGIAKEVRTYSKYEVTSVCDAHFKLTDETGTIDVSYPLRCQVAEEQCLHSANNTWLQIRHSCLHALSQRSDLGEPPGS